MRAGLRFEAASLLICLLATIIFIAILQAEGLSFSASGSSGVLIPICILLGLSVFYRSVRRDERIAGATFALGILLWATAIIGGTALAACSWRLPFIDAQLANADAVIGADVASLTKLIAAHPPVARLLDHVYQASIVAVVLLACILSVAGQLHHLREFTLLFVLTITICSFIGIIIPAEGAFPYFRMPEETMKSLPPGAGVYYLNLLHAFRSGSNKTIDFSNLAGVITFPSFHLCMALLFSYAARGVRTVFWPMTVFAGLTAISIFPIGGHYAVDAIGGGAVFAMSVFIANWIGAANFKRLTPPSQAQDLPTHALTYRNRECKSRLRSPIERRSNLLGPLKSIRRIGPQREP